jgi:hypothetical protein
MLAPAVAVDLGAAEAGQQIGDPARHEMRVVELGRDVDGELAPAQRLLHQPGIRRRAHEVAAEPDEGLGRAVEHRPDGAEHVVAVLARRVEPEFAVECFEERDGRLLVDADGAVALHVGMAAHRAQARARPADMAAQE